MKCRFHPGGCRFALPSCQVAYSIAAAAGLLNTHLALALDSPAKKQDSVPQTVLVTATVGATEAKRANASYSVLDAKDLGKF